MNNPNTNQFNPADWEIVKDEPKKTNKFNPEDWEMVNNEPEQEGFGKSLVYAPFRAGKDALTGAWKGLQKIPEMYRQGDEQIQGIVDLINKQGDYSNPENRKHAAMQGLAGLNEQINNLSQLPKWLASYGEKRLNLLPKGSEDFVGKHLVPEDTTESINQLFDQPKNKGEKLLRGMTRNALALTGAGQLPGIIRNLPHFTRRGASQKLRQARELGRERNMQPLDINPELVEDTRQYLPNNLPNRNSIDAAHYGDYNSLFNLQSDVGKEASDYARSLFSAADRAHGRAGLAARNRLLEDIHHNLQEQGHHDVSRLLREGQRDYRRYMGFRPYRNALALAAVAAAVPKNHLTRLAGKILSHRNQ